MTSELRSFDERYERVLTLARALEKHHDEVVDWYSLRRLMATSTSRLLSLTVNCRSRTASRMRHSCENACPLSRRACQPDAVLQRQCMAQHCDYLDLYRWQPGQREVFVE